MRTQAKMSLLGLICVSLVAMLVNCAPPRVHCWKDGHMEFFDAEAGEADIGPRVYQRGSEVTFYCRGRDWGDISAVHVEITDSKGRLANTVPLSFSGLSFPFGSVWKGTWDDWKSSLWTELDEIPVGRYAANFKVSWAPGAEDDTLTRQTPFYVIFNTSEVEEGAGFTFAETAVWFGSRYNCDLALTYTLHPDDRRIFEIAIEEVSGETDSYRAAHKLSKWVGNHFKYDLSYHTNDTVDLLLNHDSAQCADEACFLVALLSAVGIPAHPVTADAGVEVGDAGWNFDTWTEARLEGPSEPENWYILHPHQYPTMQPTPRGTFGTDYGVATKKSNDLNIMADLGWMEHMDEVTDSKCDVRFERNACKEPKEQCTYVASWLDHLCQSGYWGEGHWECPPSRVTAALQIVPARTRLVVGEELNFRTTLFAEREMEDVLVVRVISNDIRSRMWPDTILAEYHHPVRLPIRESKEFDDHFEVPGDFMTSDELLLEARIGEYYAVVPIEVAPRFEWKLEVTEPTEAEPRPVLTLTIENPGEMAHNIRVQLDPPLGVKVETPTEIVHSIMPAESREFKWPLAEDMPTDIAVVTLIIESKDGGSVRITENLTAP